VLRDAQDVGDAVRDGGLMTERLPRLHPPFADPRRQALHAAIVGGRRGTRPQAFHLAAPDGSLVGPFGLMLQAPHLGAPLQELGAAVRFATSFTDRAREVAILTVAAVTGSDYEVYAHERVGTMAGLSRAELDGIRTGAFAHEVGVDGVEAMTALVARRLAEGRSLGDDDYSAAVGVLGEQQLLELVVLVGYYTMLAQLMSVFGVGAPDAIDDTAAP
jgi:4-carboxymuconolactone decarboxylase